MFTWQLVQEEIIALPRFLKYAWTVLALVVLGILCAVFNIFQWSLQEELLLAKGRELESSILVKRANLREYPACQARFTEVARSYASYLSMFQRPFSQQNFIDFVANAAEKSGVSLLHVQPMPSEVGGKDDKYLQSYSWQIAASSDYQQFSDFLRFISVSGAPIFVTTSAMQLKRNDKANRVEQGQALVIDAKLDAYVASGVSLPAEIVAAGQKLPPIDMSLPVMPRDPFVAAETASKHKLFGINAWPVARLRLVGILRQADANLAVLQDPLLDIYTAGLGEKVGSEQAVIAAIEDNAVEFTDGRKLRFSTVLNLVHEQHKNNNSTSPEGEE